MAKKNSFLKVISVWIGEAIDKIMLWIIARGFGWMLALMLSLPHRKRMSHNNGIGATGWLQIVDNPEFPEHDFFVAGRKFPARIRHASISFLDDAMNCFRSISIKFSDHHFRSPFDLELNTGQRSAFWSAASFFKFGSLGKEKWLWLVSFVVCVSISMYLLYKSMGGIRPIPVGTAYAVWAGIGAVCSVIFGIFIFAEPVTIWRMVFLTTLIISLVGLQIVTPV